MNTSHSIASRLLAGLGITAFVAGVGLFASSRPAHTAGGPIPVTVSNSPLLTSDVTLADQQPFSKRFDLTFSNGAANKSFTVPAGKRLVITYVSTDAGVAVGAHVLLDLATINNGAEVESHLPAISQGVILGQEVYASSAPMTVYADPGSTVTFAALNSDTGSGGMIVGIYGYLTTP